MHWANLRLLGRQQGILKTGRFFQYHLCGGCYHAPRGLQCERCHRFLQNNSQHSCQGLPTAFPAEGPMCFCISRLWLPESLSISTPHLNHPDQSVRSAPAPGFCRTTLPAASPGLCGCVYAQCQVTSQIPGTSLTEDDAVNAKTFHVHELGGLILLKCPVYPKWPESVQSLSKFQ